MTYVSPSALKIGTTITFTLGGVWEQPADLDHIHFECFGLGSLHYTKDIADVETVQPGGWNLKIPYDILSSATPSTYNLTLTGVAKDMTELFVLQTNNF